ncbi:MAG TPA: hypothetical protein VF362_00315, partial [Demequinaceae bacterium]
PPPTTTGPPVPPPPSSWPQSPAPASGPFSFPTTGSVPRPPASGVPVPPPPLPWPQSPAPASAPAIPQFVLPASGSLPAASGSLPAAKEGRRGLFGIAWLGGRKAGKSEDAVPASSGGPAGDDGDGDEPSNRIAAFFERASVLVVLGLFAFVGIGSGVYLLFFRPEPVVMPPSVHTIPRPTPTFEPLVVTDATDFLAALPKMDLAYGLRSAESTVMRPVTVWPSRFAEEWLLTYDAGAGGTMTVQAVQHYKLEVATSTYQHLLDVATAEALAARSAGPSPSPGASPAVSPSPAPSTSANPSPTDAPGMVMGTVYVDKVEVGKSFKVVKDVTESVADPAGGDPTEVTRKVAVVTWQNGTGVFIMTADPAVIDDLFLGYGL